MIKCSLLRKACKRYLRYRLRKAYKNYLMYRPVIKTVYRKLLWSSWSLVMCCVYLLIYYNGFRFGSASYSYIVLLFLYFPLLSFITTETKKYDKKQEIIIEKIVEDKVLVTQVRSYFLLLIIFSVNTVFSFVVSILSFFILDVFTTNYTPKMYWKLVGYNVFNVEIQDFMISEGEKYVWTTTKTLISKNSINNIGGHKIQVVEIQPGVLLDIYD